MAALRHLTRTIRPLYRAVRCVTTAAFVLTAVALLASWLPARRASKADPIEVLRSE